MVYQAGIWSLEPDIRAGLGHNFYPKVTTFQPDQDDDDWYYRSNLRESLTHMFSSLTLIVENKDLLQFVLQQMGMSDQSQTTIESYLFFLSCFSFND
ncbi:MAG: hypothetical protein MHPSP_001512, partial [Paramarteilia canceri]